MKRITWIWLNPCWRSTAVPFALRCMRVIMACPESKPGLFWSRSRRVSVLLLVSTLSGLVYRETLCISIGFQVRFALLGTIALSVKSDPSSLFAENTDKEPHTQLINNNIFTSYTTSEQSMAVFWAQCLCEKWHECEWADGDECLCSLRSIPLRLSEKLFIFVFVFLFFFSPSCVLVFVMLDKKSMAGSSSGV